MRRWTKHSRAKWNPGAALSLRGLGRSVTDVFKVRNVYDGLAIGGGIVAALGLPTVVDGLIPLTWKSKLPFRLTGGWFGYVMNAASAGVAGYLAGVIFNRSIGEKVFLGGIGATIAKVLLDNVPMLRGWTGNVTLSSYGDYNLQRVIENEVAAELRAGQGMSAYATPTQMLTAPSLGDYASPAGVMAASALGQYPGGVEEFDSGKSLF